MQKSSKITYLGKIYRNYLGIFVTFVTISILFGLFYINSAHADSTSVSASATVLESCSVESTNNDHTATIVAGNYEQIGDDTVFSINCNDPNGYIIYAVGNSGDTEGNTDLIASNNDESVNNNIITGLNTSGDISNWSFKLSNPTENLTILPNFNESSIIPTTRTAVVKRSAGTTSPTVDSFHASYNAYISKTQPVDIYEGKVKYILFHPSTTIVTYYTITYNTNGGTPNIESQSGNTTDPTITLSSTTPSKYGYTFQGWCTVQPTDNNTRLPSCSGTTYRRGNSYSLSRGTNITLYAMWESNLTTCNTTGVRLKDNRCWSKSNVATDVRFSDASSYCSGSWHLPSQSEYNSLLLAYFPSAYISYGGYHYDFKDDNERMSFVKDWTGNTYAYYGDYWTATYRDSTYIFDFGFSNQSISTHGVRPPSSTSSVRCISS